MSEGRLIKGGSTRGAFYALPRYAADLGFRFKKRLRNRSLREDDVLDALRRKATILTRLKANVSDIFAYAFSEMLNNAIEHSTSKFIEIEASISEGTVTFVVDDFGVGVFKNVMRKHHLESELEAIQDLLKGKTTTAPEGHSGEGIFFTSKAGDVLVLESFKYTLRVDNMVGDVFIGERRRSKRGTKVIFSVSETSTRRLIDIFARHATMLGEPAFDKSEIHVKLYTLGTVHISRSQARRLLSGLNRFRAVTLDFDGVETIGQGFADEIFRVFRRGHPQIALSPINMNSAVRFMVDRASSEA